MKLVSLGMSSTAPACSMRLGDSCSFDGRNEENFEGIHSIADSSSQFPPAFDMSAPSARLSPPMTRNMMTRDMNIPDEYRFITQSFRVRL
jgi:hypothetical protein